jgi:general secretion pathway protein H
VTRASPCVLHRDERPGPTVPLPQRRLSRPPLHRRAGFTLIELLVVMVIIGVLVAALTLAVGNAGGERTLSNESDRFQALLGHACAQAELSGREIGAVVSSDGFTFRRLDGTEWRDMIKDQELRTRHWPAGLRVEMTRDGRPLDLAVPGHDAPQLVCFSSGELTPFSLVLALGDASVRYQVKGDDDGTLKTSRLDARR